MRSKFPNRLYDGKFFLAYGQDQHQGRRPYQEDFFGFYEPEDLAGIRREGLLFVLADGMGGTNKGDTASIMAVEGMIRNYRESLLGSVPEALNAAVNRTNDEIFQRGLADRRYWKMGTTCVAVLVKEGELYFVSVGDSHLYLLRGGRLTLLNEDHSVGVEMDRRAKAGLMTEEEALAHPSRDKLVSSLGEKAISKVDVARSPLKLAPGDKLIVCSDGLYGYFDTSRIPDLVTKLPPQKAVERLIHETLAQDHENQDNISIQVIEVIGEARKSDVQTFIREKTHSRKSKDRKGKKKTLAIAGIAGGAVAFFALGVLTGRFLLSPGKPEIPATPPSGDQKSGLDASRDDVPPDSNINNHELESKLKQILETLKQGELWEDQWLIKQKGLAENKEAERDAKIHLQTATKQEASVINTQIKDYESKIDALGKELGKIEDAIKTQITTVKTGFSKVNWEDPNNWTLFLEGWKKLAENPAFQQLIEQLVNQSKAIHAPESKDNQ
jgi:PPM family protein phosphatase